MEKYQFGFGCMRLPLLNADDVTSFDFAKTEQLFDAYLNFGFTYFIPLIPITVTSAKKPSAKRWLSGIRAAPLNLLQKCRCVILKIRQIWKQFLTNNVQTAALITLITTFCITWAPMYMKNPENTERLILSPLNLKTAALTRKENKR